MSSKLRTAGIDVKEMGIDIVIRELICGDTDRRKLIELVFEYFGEDDAELVLKICLFFKRPGVYQHVGKEVVEKLTKLLEGEV